MLINSKDILLRVFNRLIAWSIDLQLAPVNYHSCEVGLVLMKVIMSDEPALLFVSFKHTSHTILLLTEQSMYDEL